MVLAVGYNYLQAIADASRIETVSAQVNTAQALYNQASDQVKAGTSPAIDGLRAQVELKTRQQQLIQAKNDFAIQKLTLARVIGLAPGQQFELTDKSPYEPFAGMTLDEALQRAYASRSDFRLPPPRCARRNIRKKRRALNTIRRFPSARITASLAPLPPSPRTEFSMCAAR